MCYTDGIDIRSLVADTAGGVITADVHVSEDAVWFDGHFPGAPVLPGVAQVALVVDMLNRALEAPHRAVRVSRVRFKQPIRPGDVIGVRLERKGTAAGSWGLHLSVEAVPVCTGILDISGSVAEWEDAVTPDFEAGT